jgi:ATP/maltotriose-dependent transcriptional regulator MalT
MSPAARLSRDRLTVRLREAAAFPAAVVLAPEGFGKTTAVRQFVETYPAETYELALLPEHGTLAAFARALAQTLAPVAPGLLSSYAHAIECALQSDKAEEELAIWFLGHLDRNAERLIVIDDLHHAASDARIARLMERLLEGSRPGYRWLLAGREFANAQSWTVAGLCGAPLDERDLRLTPEEMQEIASSIGLSSTLADALYAMSEGWPLAFGLGAAMPEWIARLEQLRPASARGLLAFLAEQYFLQCDPALREVLLQICVFTTIDGDIAAAAPWSAAWAQLQRLADGQLLLLRHDGSIQLREVFRQFLEQRLSQRSSEAVRDACSAAAQMLESGGRIADALRLYARATNDAKILDLCEQYGFTLVDEGRIEDLLAPLSAIEAKVASQHPAALAIQAIAESNASRNDIAESWYLLAIERADSPVLRAKIAYRYGLELVRHGRKDGIEILEPYLAAPLPLDLGASLRSTLATGYVLAERFSDARRTISSALSLLGPSSPKQLQAKILHHAAWVALFTGDIESARTQASQAVEYALACDMYDVAARAYSVLYNISYDVEDDPQQTRETLDRIWDCGLKAGSAQMRWFALLGNIDVCAEMGDRESLAAIQKVIVAHGVDYAELSTSEALLPAEALMLAGRGDFAQAYEIIFPTGERQLTPDRRALRFSEIALYASAAGLADKAEAALNEVAARLRECDAASRRTIRAQIHRALAVHMAGRCAEAHEILNYAGRFGNAMSPRLRALYDSVGEIFEHWDGADNYDRVYEVLSRLRAAHFGGVAEALAALPCGREQVQVA